jgi:hypothetical protein
MTTPGQEDYDREYQWSTFAGEFVEIRFLVRPMDLWVRRELEITCQDKRSIWGTREVRDTAAFDHKEGKRIFWEHLSGNFAQSYGRCDAARRYGVQSCPKGMSDPG